MATAGIETGLEIYTCLVKSDGTVSAKRPNPAVSGDILRKILTWKEEGNSETDVVELLRNRTVPPGYTPCPWIQGILRWDQIPPDAVLKIGGCVFFTCMHAYYTGKDETISDKLRSILAQMEYTHRVQCFHDVEKVPFRTHAYVPEVHPLTGQCFCEREDDAHIFKVSCTIID